MGPILRLLLLVAAASRQGNQARSATEGATDENQADRQPRGSEDHAEDIPPTQKNKGGLLQGGAKCHES